MIPNKILNINREYWILVRNKYNKNEHHELTHII